MYIQIKHGGLGMTDKRNRVDNICSIGYNYDRAFSISTPLIESIQSVMSERACIPLLALYESYLNKTQ